MMDNSKKIKQLYNICSEDYNKHMLKTGHYKAQEKILKLLFDQIEEPILDLACGTGFLINLLSTKFSLIFGNDFSCAITKDIEKLKIPITHDNAEFLKSYTQTQKFKTIISCNLFFYVQHREKAIQRWKELLSPKGKIIFIEEYPFITPKSEEMDRYTKKLMDLINPISPEQIEKIMVQNGFSLIKKVLTPIDPKHKLYGLVFSLG